MFLSGESGWPFVPFLQPIVIRLGHPLILFNMEYSKKKRLEIPKGILCHVLGRCSDQAWMLLHENYRRDGFCLYSPLVKWNDQCIRNYHFTGKSECGTVPIDQRNLER